MLIHYSQIDINDVLPGELIPEAAGKIAKAFGIEAFYDDESDQWFLFDSSDPDNECETGETVQWLKLTQSTYFALMAIFQGI